MLSEYCTFYPSFTGVLLLSVNQLDAQKYGEGAHIYWVHLDNLVRGAKGRWIWSLWQITSLC